MKKLLSLFAVAAFVCVIGLSSCGESGPCYTCEATVFGIQSTQEFCDNDGASPISVKASALGFSEKQDVDSTAVVYKAYLEANGYTCTIN